VATLTAGRPASARRQPAGPLARLGAAGWRLFTSVDFAVLQIIALAVLATIGMTLPQLPDSAFRSATDYANGMADIHARLDPVLGPVVVDTLERLQLFQVFRSTWFSLGLVVLLFSILICTLDRLPRLWRAAAEIRVVQPPTFYDPRLPERAVVTAVPADGLRAVLRRHRFGLREVEVDGELQVMADRHRWTKLATLLTHAGLILFLVAAAVTSLLGDESGLVVAEGDSLTVQPIGTPDLLVVKNLGFEAPGLETGRPEDFTTDLAVFQNGQEIARKVIRVNDPLSVAGYTFHQNGFGPAPDLLIRDRSSGAVLWTGPVVLTDQVAGLPFGIAAVPGRDAGLQLFLDRGDDGSAVVLAIPYRVVGELPDGSPETEELGALALVPGESGTTPAIDFVVGLRGVSEYTLLIAKHDPGQGLVWLAFGLLIVGLVVTFWLPRRRIWARLRPDGEATLVARYDRYVDVDREFGAVVDDLVAARRPADPSGPTPAGEGVA
jgi:cytochrome c biogenesis protein